MLPTKRLPPIKEENDKEDDIGLSQFPPNEEEEFHHPVAVQQAPTDEKVHSGPALRLDTNVKRIHVAAMSESSESKGLKDMVYEEYRIPFKYKLYVTGSLWLLLFGFVLFSGTFTTFKLNAAEEVLVSRFENVPMLVLGTLFCGASTCALIYLSWKWKKNSIWLVERILLPGFINSATGLGNTLINVGTVHHWEVSTTAKSTIIITTIYLGVFTVPLIWSSDMLPVLTVEPRQHGPRLKRPHTPSVLQNDASGGKKVAKPMYNTRSKNKRDLQVQKKPRTINRLPAVSVGGKVNSERMAGIKLSNDGGPRGTVSGFQVQQCCLNLQSTIQVLQEALNANTSHLTAFKSEAHCRFEELEAVILEKERIIAELNIKVGNSESTSRINGIMKSVAGIFRG
ncbi:hypothetical protein V496_00061 [Pseudogymnoascus sp. VKM F-4515 (FW-2607)]|nr:hypothetical protein V496_00061 [Pseudogymnoascus sp. VKM F-4515 (FW-2607)]